MEEKDPLKLSRESTSSTDSANSDGGIECGTVIINENKTQLSCIIITAVLVLILSLILATASLVLSIYHVNSAGRHSSCVKCEDLVLEPPQFADQRPDQYVEKRIIGDVEYCCASQEDKISDLYSKVVKAAIKREKTKWADECNEDGSNSPNCYLKSNKTTAAHLFLNKQADYEEQGRYAQVHIKGWTSDQTHGFLANVQFDNDRLVIKETGLYYVYSQLTLVEYRQPSSSSSGSSIAHNIERWNIVYPDDGVEVLLRHSESKSSSRTRPYVEYVSYVGGVVPLRSGDELYVSVSEPLLVQYDAKSSYFGMYRI